MQASYDGCRDGFLCDKAGCHMTPTIAETRASGVFLREQVVMSYVDECELHRAIMLGHQMWWPKGRVDQGIKPSLEALPAFRADTRPLQTNPQVKRLRLLCPVKDTLHGLEPSANIKTCEPVMTIVML